jgi:hypothetical protein
MLKASGPLNIRDEIAILKPIGSGASAVVRLAFHFPSMQVPYRPTARLVWMPLRLFRYHKHALVCVCACVCVQLVAVKYLRVFHDDSRHQMAQELKLLYTNMGTLTGASGNRPIHSSLPTAVVGA